MKTQYSTISDSLSPKCVSQNNKEDFSYITSHFLCVGAVKTEKWKLIELFRYDGWYRFFDSTFAGDVERYRGGYNDPVASDDEARLHVLDKAITDVLIQPYDEYPNDIVAIPHRVCLVTARKSLADEINALMKEADTENLSPLRKRLSKRLKEHLGWLNRLEVCIVTEDIVKTIYRL